MSAAARPELALAGSGGSLLGPDWRVVLRRRLREPWFWCIHAGIASVAALHVAAESARWLDHHHVGAALLHLPIVLYVLPIVAAGLRYGAEGAALSGLWVGLLSVPSMVIWHGEGYDWVAELVYVVVVVALGGVVALLVERERRARTRAAAAGAAAEANVRRIALLHGVTSALLRTGEVDEALRALLPRICSVVPLDAAAIALCSDGGGLLRLVASESQGADQEVFLDALSQVDLSALGAPTSVGPVLVVPFPAGARSRGALVVAAEGGVIGADERQVLAGVTAQIALGLDNARLQMAERSRLERYAQAVTRAQEEERRHIARDLHDVATHELLLVGRGLDTLGTTSGDPTAARKLEELRDQTAGVVQFLRRFTRDLRPSVLDHFGLPAALEWLLANVRERTDLDVGLVVDGAPRRLEPESELALFRIVEEALRNVERHASASRTRVQLVFGAEVRLHICDDGVGFDVAEPVVDGDRGGCGLLGIRERAELIGAVLDIRSAPGSGTELRVTVPAAVCVG